MRRFNTHGLTPEIAAFWTRKLTIHREEAVKRGKQRYVETSHMNAMCGLVEYIRAASAHSEDRFRFIVLNRAPEKIVRSLYERKELLNVESMWLWYLDPEYPRNLINATPYLKWHYLGLLAWYVREVEARKAAYIAMLGNRYDVLSVDIDQPDWADIVSRSYGFEVPADSEVPHPHAGPSHPENDRRWNKNCATFLRRCRDSPWRIDVDEARCRLCVCSRGLRPITSRTMGGTSEYFRTYHSGAGLRGWCFYVPPLHHFPAAPLSLSWRGPSSRCRRPLRFPSAIA